jgi:hypothetical protein
MRFGTCLGSYAHLPLLHSLPAHPDITRALKSSKLPGWTMERSKTPDIPVATPSHASHLVEPDFPYRNGAWGFTTARAALGWDDEKKIAVFPWMLYGVCVERRRNVG